MPAGKPVCRHCGASLGALEALRRAACSSAACRHLEAVAHRQALFQAVGRPALQAAEAELQQAPHSVLWLHPVVEQIVALTEERRAEHRQYLQGLVDARPDEPVPALAPAEPDNALGPQEWRLCAQCRGRCCVYGATSHGFLTLPLLLRWQQQQPGNSLQDAADEFVRRLPSHHVRGSCVYHGAEGCVLPRADRADPCNRHACESLVQMREVLRTEPAAAFVAVTLQGDRAVRQAALTEGRTISLPVPTCPAGGCG